MAFSGAQSWRSSEAVEMRRGLCCLVRHRRWCAFGRRKSECGVQPDRGCTQAAIGNDVLIRGTKQTGSILIEKMVIAGN